jgi:hypothetical protein
MEDQEVPKILLKFNPAGKTDQEKTTEEMQRALTS